MSITPISNSSNSILSPSGDSNVIKLLEKQKMQLQEQIQKLNESKLDDKTKQDRVKQLQDQIQQIESLIQQKRNEKINQNINEQPAISQSDGTDDECCNYLAGMSNLILASATYSQAKIMNNTKNNLSGKGRILNVEIKLDESRGSSTATKRQELEKTEIKEHMLDKKLSETNETAQNQVKNASKEMERNEDEKDDKSDINKNGVNGDNLRTVSSNPKTQDIESVSNSKEENSQKQELKTTDGIYKRVDVRV